MINSHRLPNNVIPVNYDLELEPDLKNFTFKGRAIIDVDVKICFILKFKKILNLKNLFSIQMTDADLIIANYSKALVSNK